MPQTNRLCCLIWAACLVAPLAASAQEAKLPINLRVPVGEKDCANAMVAYALPAGLAAESLRLIETTAGKETPVAVQWDAASGKLWWVAAGVTPAKATRSFRLEKGVAPETQPIVMADSAKLVEAHFQNRQLLHYNKAHVEPGDGIDPKYGRSGHLHPVWTPGGAIVTDELPPDHLHQSGIFLAHTNAV